MPKRGSSRPVSVRMATDTLTMASRKTTSAIPWETWQRSHLLESAWLVNRFSMIFNVKTGAGYTNTGLTPSGTSGGYCSRMEMASDIGRIPTVASGSETTYECDGLWFNNTIVAVALFGGDRGAGSKCGLSCWNVNNPATYVATYIVASLSCKPPVAAA